MRRSSTGRRFIPHSVRNETSSRELDTNVEGSTRGGIEIATTECVYRHRSVVHLIEQVPDSAEQRRPAEPRRRAQVGNDRSGRGCCVCVVDKYVGPVTLLD